MLSAVLAGRKLRQQQVERRHTGGLAIYLANRQSDH